MEIAGVPARLGPDLFIRTLLPGVVVFTVFFDPIIHPLMHGFWDPLEFSDTLLVCFLCGLLVGFLFMICDLYIYQVLEGTRFWPESLRKWKYERIQKNFQKLDQELKGLIDQKKEKSIQMSTTELNELSLKISRLSARVREFPPTYDRENFTRRYPAYPTRFGNVLCEYEDYSLNRYGIHMMVFWNHLSQLLPEGTRKELGFEGAVSDLCVYLCFANLIYVLVGPAALLLQRESWVIVSNYTIPAKSLLCLILSFLAFKFLYELSLSQHKNYGRLVKSVFDLYRGKLAEELDIEIKKTYFSSKDELEEERALWKRYQDYYLDYKFIQNEA